MWVDLCAEEVPSVSFPRPPTVSMLIAVIRGGEGPEAMGAEREAWAREKKGGGRLHGRTTYCGR